MSDANGFSEPLAAFYEATHDHGDVGDEAFYVDAAVDADGPVLEGACGSGRLYLELLREGVDADGFDASAPMLDILRANAAGEGLDPTVWQADLRSVGADRSYALAIVPYNSICNLQSVEDQIASLSAFYDVLEPGGRLVFDAYVPRYEVIAESFGEWHERGEFEYEGRTLVGHTRATIADGVAQTYRTEQELRTPDGEVVARDEFVLSHLPAQQVELLARRSPFENWSAFGGFEGDPLDDGADVQVWQFNRE